METSGKTPLSGLPKCMLPSRPRVGPVALAEEVAEDVRNRDPPRVVARLLAVQRRDDVVRPERRGRRRAATAS